MTGAPLAAPDAVWSAALLARAVVAPERPRQTLAVAGGSEFGSIEPVLGRALVDAAMPLRRAGDRWELTGPVDASLAQIATWLNKNGHGGRWRGELLAVTSPTGEAVGAIERAAVRPLGITTQAVHLVGHDTAGQVWVQQRAFDKATDPGLWDTLVGGLVAAGESIATTLARETWEEAGLRTAELSGVSQFAGITVRRPVNDGYMIERIEMFEALIADTSKPVNQDGEVAGFERLTPEMLREKLRGDEFTLEAALILIEWLNLRAT